MSNKSLIYSLILCGQQLSTVVLDLRFSRYPMESSQRGGFRRQSDSAVLRVRMEYFALRSKEGHITSSPLVGSILSMPSEKVKESRAKCQGMRLISSVPLSV